MLKWFDNIFKKDNTPASALEIALSDLDGWLDQKASKPEIDEKIKAIFLDLGSRAEELDADIEAMRCAVPEKSAPTRLLNAGLAGRDALLNQMKGLSEIIVPPSKPDIPSAVLYHSRLVKCLGNTVLKFGRAQRYVAAVFPNESAKLNSDLNRVSHLLVALNDAISIGGNALLEINEARELSGKIRINIRQIDILNGDLVDASKKLSDLQSLETSITSELNELNSSEEGHKTKVQKEALTQKLCELKRFDTEMALQVSPLTKAIARLVKQDSSFGLDLKYRITIEQLSVSPETASDNEISGALHELRSKIDLLGLRDKKREKILGHIDLLIRNKTLEKLKAQYSSLLKETKALEDDLSVSCVAQEELEERGKQVSQQIQILTSTIEQNKKSLLALEDLVSVSEIELKDKLEKISGMPLTLSLRS